MMIKIFFENKPVFLTDEFSPAVTEFMHHPETIYIDEISTPAINSLLHEILIKIRVKNAINFDVLFIVLEFMM